VERPVAQVGALRIEHDHETGVADVTARREELSTGCAVEPRLDLAVRAREDVQRAAVDLRRSRRLGRSAPRRGQQEEEERDKKKARPATHRGPGHPYNGAPPASSELNLGFAFG